MEDGRLPCAEAIYRGRHQVERQMSELRAGEYGLPERLSDLYLSLIHIYPVSAIAVLDAQYRKAADVYTKVLKSDPKYDAIHREDVYKRQM